MLFRTDLALLEGIDDILVLGRTDIMRALPFPRIAGLVGIARPIAGDDDVATLLMFIIVMVDRKTSVPPPNSPTPKSDQVFEIEKG